jgi:multidrug resistance efflux pump/GAF domain-containing protein
MTVTNLIEQFHKLDVGPGQFLQNLLAAQCFLGQADSGAILRVNQEQKVDVLALYPQLKKQASNPEWLTISVRHAHEAHSSGTAILEPLEEPESSYDGSVKSHILMIPLMIADIGKTVAAFLITTEDKTALEESSQKLQLSTGLLNYSQMRPAQQNWKKNCLRLQRAMVTLSAVNQQNKFTGAAMAFCNEVASQWQCERVSVGFLKGRYVQLKAMSHTEDFSRKMKVVQDIESVMEECLDQDIEVLSPAPGDSAYISRAADILSKRYGPLTVLSLPLRQDGEVVAVLTLERPIEKLFTADEIETIRLACERCTARLFGLYESDRWIGATIAVRSRKFLASIVGPKYTWIKIIAFFLFAAMLFLIFGRGQFRSEAPFVLEATIQQVIPAPFDGYIESVEVEVGDEVEAGKSVLANLDTADLILEVAKAKADKLGYEKQVSAAMSEGKTAESQIAKERVAKTDAQIELLEYKVSQASLISPISGIVVKGDLKRQIGAPVKVGDVLFEVCPLESLRAQLHVPEDQIFDIEVGQRGELATASYPGRRIEFLVERINPIAEVENERNIFKVRVQLLDTYPWMRPGMEGVAKVSIGKRRYAWIWSRKVVNWIRMKFWL